VQLDRAMNVKADNAGTEALLANPVGTQMDRLRLAFSR
jgi:hypothetical protein